MLSRSEYSRAELDHAGTVMRRAIMVARNARRNGLTPPASRLVEDLARWLDQADDVAVATRFRHEEPEFVTIKTARELVGGRVTGRTIQRWAESGRIRARRTGRDWLVHPADVQREIQTKETPK